MAKQPLVGLIRGKKKTCLEKNILLPLVCCVVETCWELPGPVCSAVLLSKGGSCPSPGCVLGIAERFCCSADYTVPESHSALLSGVSFPGGQQMLPPELLFHPHPRVWRSQGIGTPCVVPTAPRNRACHGFSSSQESCFPLLLSSCLQL